jgi:DNA-binding NarL/FixJ family response regulator
MVPGEANCVPGWESNMPKRPNFATVFVGKSVLIREGIARILNSANFRTLASVTCADDLSPSKLQSQQLLILMLHTGDDFEAAVEQIELLRERLPKARIAVVADQYRLGEMISAFRAGANGYLIDVMTCDVFIKSIELVMMGEAVFPPEFMSMVLEFERARLNQADLHHQDDQPILLPTEDRTTQQLSPREKSIMQCLIEGASNKSIARKIDIAEATVKVHVKAILRKIRVQNRTQAAIWGMNNGSLLRPVKDDKSERPPNSIPMVSGIKQIDGSGRLELIDLMRNGTARLVK